MCVLCHTACQIDNAISIENLLEKDDAWGTVCGAMDLRLTVRGFESWVGTIA